MFYSLQKPSTGEQPLASSRDWINTCWINERMSKNNFQIFYYALKFFSVGSLGIQLCKHLNWRSCNLSSSSAIHFLCNLVRSFLGVSPCVSDTMACNLDSKIQHKIDSIYKNCLCMSSLVTCMTSNTLATWCKELTHLKRPWCLERLRAGGEGDDRG